MTGLRHILLVDDQQTPRVEKLGSGVKVTITNSGLRAFALLQGDDPVDLLVLDWVLDPPHNSTMAQSILRDLANSRFMPVFIWTEAEEQMEAEWPDEFPKECRRVIHKIDWDELLGNIENWFQESFAVRLATPWRTAVSSALESTLFELARAQPNEIKELLLADQDEDRAVSSINQMIMNTLYQNPEVQEIVSSLGSEHVTAESAIEKLQAVLTARVSSDEFRDQVSGALKALNQAAATATASAYDDLVRAEKYYCINPSDQLVRTGDIVEISVAGKLYYGLVLTPACDMVKTRHLRVALIEPEANLGLNKNDRIALHKDQTHHLASLFAFSGGEHYVANFHDLLVVHTPPALGEHSWKGDKRLSYDLPYQTFSGETVKLKRIKRVADPYRTHMIQRFAAHASRIGIPTLTRYRK